MRGWIGQTETWGYNSSPLIDRINREYHLPRRSSYCGSSQSKALDSAGNVERPRYRGGMARGFLERDSRVPIRRVTTGADSLPPGDLLVWQLGHGMHGHIGTVVKQLSRRSWLVVAANTSPPRTNGSENDGDGYWEKVVTYNPYSRLRITDGVHLKYRT